MIKCYTVDKVCGMNNTIYFHHDGTYLQYSNAKCVIFPKGKTTWEGFQRSFKDGDILATEKGSIFIYKGPMYYNKLLADFYCGYTIFNEAFVPKLFKDKHFGDVSECRFATEEEKQKLFNVIKDNGYKWNPETKTLEKLPKFKVGDQIVKRNSTSTPWIVSFVSSEYYGLKLPKGSEDIGVLPVSEQDDYELLPNKFDITTLKPFESRVLVRTDNRKWVAAFYSHYDKESRLHHCVVGGLWYEQCIPYNDETKHLLDTTNDCDEYYKTWE
jgi:hypothetical protein